MSEYKLFRELLGLTCDKSIRYLESLDTLPVHPAPEAIANLSKFDSSLPESPTDPRKVIEFLDTNGRPAAVNMAGPRFYGFVIGGSLPAALAADWLTSTWDQNSGAYNITPLTARLEQVSLKWLLDLLHLPKECAGGFVTGATQANFTSLCAARNAVMERAGWNVREQGLHGAPPLTVYIGEEAHPTVYKGLALLGIGLNQLVVIDADAQGRMRLDKLPVPQGPSIVITQAGNVNTGAIDPIGEICDKVRGANVWVHVDGAFGLWAAASQSLRYLVKGIEKADSWATDAHKYLNVPYDSGVAFVKHSEVLRKTMAVSAAYLPMEAEFRNPSEFTPELSRRGRGVDIWAALYSLGRTGVDDLVTRTCRFATMFAEGLRAAGYEIINDVVLNQVLVSFGSQEINEAVAQGIRDEGTCWCGTTVWQERSAMRISVINWATTEADVKKSLAAMLKVAQGVRAGTVVR